MSIADRTHQPAGMTARINWWNMQRLTQHVRWLHELLFSAYCAVLWLERLVAVEGSVLMAWLVYLPNVLYGLLAHLCQRPYFSPPRLLAFFALWFQLSVLIFVFVRILGRTAPARNLVRRMAGFVTVALYPSFCLRYSSFAGAFPVATPWLVVELVLMVVCVAFHLYRRSPTNAAASILVLAVHFGFWAWVTWQNWTVWSLSLHVLLGFGASVAWYFCVRLSAGYDQPVTPAAA